jgi:hypothetical protein
MVYTSNPPQWDETWVCHSCKIKIDERIHGSMPLDYSWLKDYKEVK